MLRTGTMISASGQGMRRRCRRPAAVAKRRKPYGELLSSTSAEAQADAAMRGEAVDGVAAGRQW